MRTNNFSKIYLNELIHVIKKINYLSLNKLINRIEKIQKQNGRIFFLGIGGSAANCSHAVNDFRKIAKIQCYSATDNVSELTANTNDEGWNMVFVNWLKLNNLSTKDLVFIFSVGGGNEQKNVSVNLIKAVDFTLKKKCEIASITAKKEGYSYKNSKYPILLPVIKKNLFLTPFAESFQCIIWHLIVTHPKIQKNKTKW